jgi:exopolyphosphatase / guanosine-5'-triphosphate,3'-diphosphate pyrophosphatase
MKVAIIDMGTNTFHLLLAEVKGDSHTIFHRERKAVKVGEKGINSGEITPEAWDRALKAINEFKATIDKEGVNQIFATATSAIRSASNGKALTDEIKNQTGIETEIISGTREAELILLGVRRALDIGEEKHLIMDIGGGSIEFIIADQHETYWLRSFEIGGQRLLEQFHKSDPIQMDEMMEMSSYFEKQLKELATSIGKYQPKTLIGCSGTFDTLCDIFYQGMGLIRDENSTEYSLPIKGFDIIFQELLTKNREERLAIPGMIEMRVDMIVVACVLIDYLLHTFDLTDMRVSAYALKEGVLMNIVESIQKEL